MDEGKSGQAGSAEDKGYDSFSRIPGDRVSGLKLFQYLLTSLLYFIRTLLYFRDPDLSTQELRTEVAASSSISLTESSVSLLPPDGNHYTH